MSQVASQPISNAGLDPGFRRDDGKGKIKLGPGFRWDDGVGFHRDDGKK